MNSFTNFSINNILNIVEMGIDLVKSAKITKNESNIAIFTQIKELYDRILKKIRPKNYLVRISEIIFTRRPNSKYDRKSK
jgi:hypothetical protein